MKAQVPSTTGTYSTRGPTDLVNDPDHTVGTGSISLGTSAVQVFSSTGSMSRGIFISATSGEVRLRTTANGTDLLTIPAGTHDSYRSQSSAYFLVGTATADFTVLDDASSGTWMPLPQAQWSDEFSPLYADRDGNVLEGDPNAPADAGEEVVSRSVYDEENEEYDTVYYIDNEALVTFTPTTTATTIRNLFEEVAVVIDAAWFDPDPQNPDTSMSWFHVRIDPESEYYGELPDLLDYLGGLSYVEGAGYNDIGTACGYKYDGDEDEFFGHWTDPDDPKTIDNFTWQAQNELFWLNAMQAWDDKSGPGSGTFDTGTDIGVIVVDSGVDVVQVSGHNPHPDLDDKIYRAYGGTGSKQGLAKSDGSYQKASMEGSSAANFALDTDKNEFAHGTCVAGIIGAEAFNDDETGQDPEDDRSEGIAGCGPELTIFVAKAKWKDTGYSTGGPTAASVVDIIKALKKEVPTTGYSAGLRVVTIAHVWNEPPEGMRKAIVKDIEANKRVYVAAAGNEGKEKKRYPAFWDGGNEEIPGLLGVTAADNSSGTNWGYKGTDGRPSGTNFWNGGPNSSSTTPANYSVSGYWHSVATDYGGTAGYSNDDQIDGTGFTTGDYHDFQGTSAATAHVAALVGLIYSRAKKIGRLDGGTNDVTPDEIVELLADNLQSGPLAGGSSKTIPGVVDFYEAKHSLATE